MSRVINGPELRKRRTALGLTQTAFGNLLDVSGAAVSQWERGAEPSWKMAQEIEKILDGVSPDQSDRLDVLEAEVKRLTGLVAQFLADDVPAPPQSKRKAGGR